jgi:hypothetical protein
MAELKDSSLKQKPKIHWYIFENMNQNEKILNFCMKIMFIKYSSIKNIKESITFKIKTTFKKCEFYI